MLSLLVMMKQGLRFLFVLSLVISGCRQPDGSGSPISAPQVPGTPADIPTANPAATPASQPGTSQGTSSGGGGFADRSVKQALDVAKMSLARMIHYASPEIFAKFPPEKNQAWFAKLIAGTELRIDLEPSRYGSPLKFDYDLKAGKIFATKHFVNGFQDSRLWTKPSEEQHRILVDLMADLLHEASHFYGVGVTEASDPNSDSWALFLLEELSRDHLACLSQESGDSLSALYLHRPSGMFVSRRIESPKDGKIPDSYQQWRQNLGDNSFRFLTSPKFFLEKPEDKQFLKYGYTIRNTDLMAQRLIDLSGVKVGTILDQKQASKAYDEDLVFLFQGPSYSRGTFEKDAYRFPQEAESALGIPRSDGHEIVYHREYWAGNAVHSTLNGEVMDEADVQVYDQLRLDPKSLKGTYYYGLKSVEAKLTPEEAASENNPLYTKKHSYLCKRMGAKPLKLERFKSDRELNKAEIDPEADELPIAGDEGFVDDPDYSSYLKTLSRVLKQNQEFANERGELRIQGKTSTGRFCEVELYLGPPEQIQATSIISIREESDAADPMNYRSAMYQVNFQISDGRVTIPESGRFYVIEKAEATDRELHFQHQTPADYGTFRDNKEMIESGHKSLKIRFDPATGRLLSATAHDLTNQIPDLTCVLTAQ